MILVVYSCTPYHDNGGNISVLPVMILELYFCTPHHVNSGVSLYSHHDNGGVFLHSPS